MYELLFVQGQTLKNIGWSTSVATGESQEQLLDLMKSELAKKEFFLLITASLLKKIEWLLTMVLILVNTLSKRCNEYGF